MTEPTAAGFGHLVIRAGPAGLQPAGHLHEAGRNHPMLEARPAPGAFFATSPRHLADFAAAPGPRVRHTTHVVRVERPVQPADAVIARVLENKWRALGRAR